MADPRVNKNFRISADLDRRLKSELYDRLYAGWWNASVATKVQSAGPGRPRVGRTEMVWSNRDLTRYGRLFDLDAPGVFS